MGHFIFFWTIRNLFESDNNKKIDFLSQNSEEEKKIMGPFILQSFTK